ncbi:MAG TPA: hypothetical protein PLD95_01365 [bacterium]|jgi:ABC-type dipeptide/oligopeptide/nickel transport system permease subunit|nr:hypothetical protein [bacterium]HOG38098.1 hypothetical protein [bacterium]HQI03154.1 hypothetical protein [bacterium]
MGETQNNRDYFGKKIDEIIDSIVGFFFETFPYISLMLAFLFLLYKLLKPAIIIEY